jgi:hypothetical protein
LLLLLLRCLSRDSPLGHHSAALILHALHLGHDDSRVFTLCVDVVNLGDFASGGQGRIEDMVKVDYPTPPALDMVRYVDSSAAYSLGSMFKIPSVPAVLRVYAVSVGI